MIVFNRSRKKRNQEATVAAFNIKICIRARVRLKNKHKHEACAWALLIKIESSGLSLLHWRTDRFIRIQLINFIYLKNMIIKIDIALHFLLLNEIKFVTICQFYLIFNCTYYGIVSNWPILCWLLNPFTIKQPLSENQQVMLKSKASLSQLFLSPRW